MDDLTAVVLGLIAIVPTTITAIGAAKISRTNKQNHALSQRNAAILQGNGKGNVMEMLEKVLEWEGQHALDDDVRFGRLEGAIKNTARRANRRG